MSTKKFDGRRGYNAPSAIPKVQDEVSNINFNCVECQQDYNSIHDIKLHIDQNPDHQRIEGPNFGGINCERCRLGELPNLNAVQVGGSMLFIYCSDCLKDTDYEDENVVKFDADSELFWLRLKQFFYFRDLACARCNSNWMMYSIDGCCLCESCITKDPKLADLEKVADSDDGFLASLFNDTTFTGGSSVLTKADATTHSEWDEPASSSRGNWYDDEEEEEEEEALEEEKIDEPTVDAQEEREISSVVQTPTPTPTPTPESIVEESVTVEVKKLDNKKKKSKKVVELQQQQQQHEISTPVQAKKFEKVNSSSQKIVQTAESKRVAEEYVKYIKFFCTDCETSVNSQSEIESHTKEKDHLRIECPNVGLIYCEKCQCGDIQRLNVVQIGGNMLTTYCNSCLKTCADEYENSSSVKYGDGDFMRRLRQYLVLKDLRCSKCQSDWILNLDLDSGRVLCQKCINSAGITNFIDDANNLYLASVFKDPSFDTSGGNLQEALVEKNVPAAEHNKEVNESSGMSPSEIKLSERKSKNQRQKERRKAKAVLESQRSREATEETESTPAPTEEESQMTPAEIKLAKRKAKNQRQKERRKAKAALISQQSKEVTEEPEYIPEASASAEIEKPDKKSESKKVISGPTPPQEESTLVSTPKPIKKTVKDKSSIQSVSEATAADKAVSRITFTCTDCDKSINSFNSLTAHIGSDNHSRIEGPDRGLVFCEKCHNGDTRELQVVEVGGTMLMIYCNECVKETDFENPITIGFDKKDLFVRRLRQYLSFKELACIKCGSDWMINFADGKVLCDKCTPTGVDFVTDSDAIFLASVFGDSTLDANSGTSAVELERTNGDLPIEENVKVASASNSDPDQVTAPVTIKESSVDESKPDKKKKKRKRKKNSKTSREATTEPESASSALVTPAPEPVQEPAPVVSPKPVLKTARGSQSAGDVAAAESFVKSITFTCTDCEKSVNSFDKLASHIASHDHSRIEGPDVGLVFCEKCHNGDTRELQVVEVGGTMLMVYCKDCFKEIDYENPSLVGYNNGELFLRRLRQYLYFKDLTCTKCNSDWMLNCVNGKVSCVKCTPPEADFITDSDGTFLASVFSDSSLEIGSPDIIESTPVAVAVSVPVSVAVPVAVPVSVPTKKYVKPEINGKFTNGFKKAERQNTPETAKPTHQYSSIRSNQQSHNNELGNGKEFSSKRQNLPDVINQQEPEPSDPYLMKVKRVNDLIKASTPVQQQLTFSSVKEYLQHISYSIFLEELFESDIFSDLTIEWSKKKNDKYEKLTASFSYKEVMDAYVPEKMRHLRKSAFTMGQGIILLRKRDKDLLQKPEIWCCSVAYNKVTKVGRKKLIQTHLDVYNWNESKLPVGASSKGFAILPCSAVVTRVLQAMGNLENPSFKELLLGKTPIKQIFFKNYIGKYTNTLNESQKVALQSALNNKITILKGPPGSGKTSTIYEMILQLVDQLSYYPVLVVAASNLAVDNIAEKLLEKHKDDIIRIVSVSKESEYDEEHVLGSVCLHHKIRRALPASIREDYDLLASGRQNDISKNRFTKLLDTTKEYSEQLVAQAKIIFSTTVTIAGPYLKRVKQLPVVIMDEATQTSEPASLIPLAAPGIKKIIFVGDEAQLSAFTRVKALEMSLFERTLKNGSYEKPFMLDTQYRMHPEISNFARTNFYNGELKDGVTAADRHIDNIKYPIYFWDHAGLAGASESKVYSQGGEETGYSLVNKKEAQFICRIIENLIVDKQIQPERIGIMTGYAGQRDLISSLLESNRVINPFSKRVNISVDKEDIKASKGISVHQVNGIIVASVDAFQGREKDFIVMSCVRSNPEGNIGFLRDRRRMNVALTRAKCSLIFSGDAQCLKKGDFMWKKYIQGLETQGYVFKGNLSY